MPKKQKPTDEEISWNKEGKALERAKEKKQKLMIKIEQGYFPIIEYYRRQMDYSEMDKWTARKDFLKICVDTENMMIDPIAEMKKEIKMWKKSLETSDSD